MSDEKDILNEAIDSIKQQPCPGLPRELTRQTLDRLVEAQAEETISQPRGLPDAQRHLGSMAKIACAAGILLCLGYGIGTMSGPKPIDLEQLQANLTATLEPALRENITREMDQRYQLALANTYVRIKAELTEQYQNDMNRFAAQTLAASNAVTNRLLTELVDTIQTEQNQDLRQIAAAIGQIERNRLLDREALLTEFTGELQQTRQEFVQLLAATAPESEGAEDDSPPRTEDRID